MVISGWRKSWICFWSWLIYLESWLIYFQSRLSLNMKWFQSAPQARHRRHCHVLLSWKKNVKLPRLTWECGTCRNDKIIKCPRIHPEIGLRIKRYYYRGMFPWGITQPFHRVLYCHLCNPPACVLRQGNSIIHTRFISKYWARLAA